MDCCFFGQDTEAGGIQDGYRPTRRRTPAERAPSDSRKNAKKDSQVKSVREKKRQGNITTKWLKQNYCACPDVCLPREIVYEQYLEFCHRDNLIPACKATFGKLIRNAFPDVTSKRLGTRGHSKYHYNGIGIKQVSEFRNSRPTFEGVTRFSSKAASSEGGTLKTFSLSSKVGTLLPPFPDIEDLNVSASDDKTKMAIFILMYKTHCQCIVDVVINGNFEEDVKLTVSCTSKENEIRLFLLHFWQGFPEHLMSLTKLDIFLDFIAVCDSILYRTLLDILIPSTSYQIPERLLRDIQNTGMHWSYWMQSSLENMRSNLIEAKMSTARRFGRSLTRYVAFHHIIHVIRPILASGTQDLLYKELDSLLPDVARCYWSLNAGQNGNHPLSDIITAQAKSFQTVIKSSDSVDTLIESLDRIILEVKDWKEGSKMEIRNFVLSWVYMQNKISRILTEQQSRFFTPFHILSSLIQEYILLAAETQSDKEREERIHSNFKKHLRNTDSDISDARLPTSCFLVKEAKNAKHTNKPQRQVESNNAELDERSVLNSVLKGTDNHRIESTYHYWKETDDTRNNFYASYKRPSCQYATNPSCVTEVFGDHLSCISSREHTQDNINEMYHLASGNYVNSDYILQPDQIFNSPGGFNGSQFEYYQPEMNVCSMMNHRTFSNSDPILKISDSGQNSSAFSAPATFHHCL